MNEDRLWEMTKRRVFLCDNAPVCPECKDAQIQLVGYIECNPAKWKCRICKAMFKFEPEIKL